MSYLQKISDAIYDANPDLFLPDLVFNIAEEADKEIEKLKERITKYEQCIGSMSLSISKAVNEAGILDETLSL